MRPQRPAARLVLTEVLRLGSESGADDAFGRVMDVELGASGRIYVADDLNWRISVFDGSGRLLRRVGRRGPGPGEFERPWYLAVDRLDSLFVWDGALARISVFGPDFRFARSFEAPGRWVVSGFSVRADGTLLVGAFAPGTVGSIHVLSRQGRVLRSFGPSVD
ncbi:MAG TPA: 6-bladed beta-propeller, partial [Longimicrobium sp.]|nr:6-bladed beta-propeller [Longimicrobium sp.]